MTRGCEEAVRTLSASAQADVYIEAAHEGCDMNVKISRTRFEDLCFDLYKAATGVIKKALADAGLATEDVDMVLLAGGKLASSHVFIWCLVVVVGRGEESLLCGRGSETRLLRGTIVNRTYGTHKTLYISLFFPRVVSNDGMK